MWGSMHSVPFILASLGVVLFCSRGFRLSMLFVLGSSVPAFAICELLLRPQLAKTATGATIHEQHRHPSPTTSGIQHPSTLLPFPPPVSRDRFSFYFQVLPGPTQKIWQPCLVEKVVNSQQPTKQPVVGRHDQQVDAPNHRVIVASDGCGNTLRNDRALCRQTATVSRGARSSPPATANPNAINDKTTIWEHPPVRRDHEQFYARPCDLWKSSTRERGVSHTKNTDRGTTSVPLPTPPLGAAAWASQNLFHPPPPPPSLSRARTMETYCTPWWPVLGSLLA